MSHAPHDPATGSFLYDDCPECDARAAEPLHAIQHLDGVSLARAWRAMRAVRWSHPAESWDLPLSGNDVRLLNALYSIGVVLQRCGIEPEEIERRALTAHLESVAKLADVLAVDVPRDVLVRAVQLGAVPA